MFIILKFLAICTSRVMNKFHLFSLVPYSYLLKMFVRLLLIGIKHDKYISPEALKKVYSSKSVCSSKLSFPFNGGTVIDELF